MSLIRIINYESPIYYFYIFNSSPICTLFTLRPLFTLLTFLSGFSLGV